MTQEEKSLLLKDLCARVPYHPKGHVVNSRSGAQCDEWLICATFTMFTNIRTNCHLYLRPMSSITDEERKEFESLGWRIDEIDGNTPWNHNSYNVFDGVDWLNAHHFDYRNLIERGLALEAPDDMYDLNNNI